MKHLRFIALFLCIIIALLSLSGCNKDITQESQTESETSSETEKETTKKPSKPKPVVYDDEAPENPAQLPKYNGKEFDYTNVYLGQQSVMHVASKTNKDEYNAYLKLLNKDGYSLYASNTLGENLFATYINDTHIINVAYIPAFKQTRVIIDERSIFSLPGLEEENVYTSTVEPSLILLSDNKISWPGRMGYIYQLSDGSFFIIDGGWGDTNPTLSTSPLIMSVLEEYAPDPNNIKISAWLITHQHTDHMGAMYDISNNEEYRSKLSIDKIIYNMPNQQSLSNQDKDSSGSTTMVTTGLKMTACINNLKPKEVVKAHPGQVFYIKDVKLTIYSSQDLLLNAPMSSSASAFLLQGIFTHNDTSIVSKVEFQGKTTLYMADASGQANSYVLDPVYKDALDADILQVAHHGYADTVADKVYANISPEIVFWPVRRGHYDGKNPDGSIYYEGGSAYFGVSLVTMNASLFKDGIKHVYFENDVCIVINDFETWKGVEWDALPDQ